MLKKFLLILISTLSLANICFASSVEACNDQSKTNKSSQSTQTIQKSNLTHYIVPDVCGATYTKEDDDLFTKLSNANDFAAIDKMINSGRIVILKKGEKVEILEFGFFRHKIRTSDGKVLYISREFVK